LNDLKVILQGILPNSIEFQVTIAPDVGMVRVDTTQIHQVLMNLCINARDAMPNGGMLRLSAVNLEVDENFARMEPKVRVGNYAVITVEDTGMGIAPEVCDRIFEPFFTTKPEGQGTGLGLSVVERILQSHGGFITMSSQVGQGSRFQVYLPRCEPTSLPSTGVTEPPVGKGELILVVDSEVTICDILKTTLETYHYQVLTAQNSFEALALYAQSSQDIRAALMDLDLPQMDGLTLIALFQRINPQVQVIAMNDTPFPTQPAVVPQGAVKCLLSKPFTYQELLNTLSETLRV
jgi:CheY-like chemotaxis protein